MELVGVGKLWELQGLSLNLKLSLVFQKTSYFRCTRTPRVPKYLSSEIFEFFRRLIRAEGSSKWDPICACEREGEFF